MSAASPNRVVIWAAMFVGPVAYAGIVLSGAVPMNPEGLPGAAVAALAGAALASVVASRIVWARLVAGAEEEAGRGAGPRAIAGPDPVLARAAVVWALDEIAAVVGFVLAWFGTPFLYCVPFFLVSLALLAVDHPGRLG